jgi:DNA repair protein RecO (recombination protein O)
VVQLGGIVCDECAPPGSPRIERSTIALLGALLTGDWARAEAAPERDRNQASGIVAAYAQWHLERGLRSLPHVTRDADEPATRPVAYPPAADRPAVDRPVAGAPAQTGTP